MNDGEINNLRNSFLEYLKNDLHRGVKTLENYDRYIRRFIKNTKIKKPEDITECVIKEFSDYLKNQKVKYLEGGDVLYRKLSKNTQNYYFIALRNFVKYLNKRGFTTIDIKKIKLVKTVNKKFETITQEEISALSNETCIKNVKCMRDMSIVYIFLYTDLRVSELCALNKQDFDMQKGIIHVRSGRNKRSVSLPEYAKEKLNKYLSIRNSDDDALFVNNGKRISNAGDTRLSHRSVQRIVKEYAKKAGIKKKVTPNVLRGVTFVV